MKPLHTIHPSQVQAGQIGSQSHVSVTPSAAENKDQNRVGHKIHIAAVLS
jgi:hypothetical protein